MKSFKTSCTAVSLLITLLLLFDGCNDAEPARIREIGGVLLHITEKHPISDTWIILAGIRNSNYELVLIDSVKTDSEGKFKFNFKKNDITEPFVYSKKEGFLDSKNYWGNIRLVANRLAKDYDTLYMGSGAKVKIFSLTESPGNVSINASVLSPGVYLQTEGLSPVENINLYTDIALPPLNYETNPIFYDLNKSLEFRIVVNGIEHYETHDLIEFATKEIEIQY